MPNFKQFIDQIRQNQKQYFLTGMENEVWYKRIFYALTSFISVFYGEIQNLRLFTRVASTTYTTMLALIPFMVVGGSLIITFNKEANVTEIITRINQFVAPVAGDVIANFLSQSFERTLDLGLGPIGVIALVVTSVMLFVHIEDCINDIWHVVKPRAFYLRILLFYAVVTLGPLLVSFSMFQATELLPNMIKEDSTWQLFQDTVIIFLASFILFKFLPNTRVRIKFAFIPAVIAAICLQIAKWGFGIYMSIAFKSSYSILYGALGIIPMTLLWLYFIWSIIYFGVEASYCLQNMRSLSLRWCYDSNPNGAEWVFIGSYAALEVLSALVRNLCAGKEPPTADALAVECVYPTQAIQAILARLGQINVVKRMENDFANTYILAKPLDAIAIKEVMKLFDESTPRVQRHPKLQALVEQLIAAQEQIWSDSNANILREDGVSLKDVSSVPTMNDLHMDEGEGHLLINKRMMLGVKVDDLHVDDGEG
ncbi:MAG: YihY family inner membrane protein [Proteobacteria bacterium]|nr:YihY family inner membrane protein [Pseudomonadota bacterium]